MTALADAVNYILRYCVDTLFSDFGGKSPDREGGQVVFCMAEYFLSYKNTTCSVRLNRKST